MKRPEDLKTKIFLDSGNPSDTKEMINLLGFLDGQTTNPSLVAKNPDLQQKISQGEALSNEDINAFYKKIIKEISEMIPQGSISIEVYGDEETSKQTMLDQANEMNTWISNAHIKFPITTAGIEAAHDFTLKGGRVNMTLIFSQEQSAAVYAATLGAKKGDVFLSPFVGRLDDKGMNGMSLISNIQKIYIPSDGHVEILVASVRSLDHFMASLATGADIITAPKKILKAWHDAGMPIPHKNFIYEAANLKNIEYQEQILESDLTSYNLSHELTTAGLRKFASDWKALINK